MTTLREELQECVKNMIEKGELANDGKCKICGSSDFFAYLPQDIRVNTNDLSWIKIWENWDNYHQSYDIGCIRCRASNRKKIEDLSKLINELLALDKDIKSGSVNFPIVKKSIQDIIAIYSQ